MKRILGMVIVLVLLAQPASAAGPWYYKSFWTSSAWSRQINYYQQRYPGRTDDWPYARVAYRTNRAVCYWCTSPVSTSPTAIRPRHTSPYHCHSAYTGVCVQNGFEVVGPFNLYRLVGGYWFTFPLPSQGGPYLTNDVNCRLDYSIGQDVVINKCGVIAASGDTVFLGMQFVVKTSTWGVIPGASVGHTFGYRVNTITGAVSGPYLTQP